MHRDLSNAALVLLGHGSTVNADSAAPVLQHATELRRRNIFASVHEAFWKQDPQIDAVLARTAAPRVFIAPLFISEGYFSDDVIPRALGFNLAGDRGSRVAHRESQELNYCRPIGTHERMTAVLLARAREVVAQFPFPRRPNPADTTLFIAGHGTEQHERSREAVELQAQRIAATREYADAQAVFLEEAPRIGECYTLARTKHIVIVPFFISDGMHTREDLPVLLGEPKSAVRQRLAAGQPTWRNPTERHGKLVWCSPAAGTAPEIADVILERVYELAE